ncbi:hypothetical protein EJV47_20065 [Hymenobacter gummosus]|uniref:Uncharacterized protein n=1 Tax=Hymenobacter gummosus TaxID=1776032 RepID=A0A3S0IL49_9BACT|nr:hypothetical protein [Hymenobacter gummosus]RTQ47192.1 hypothetical protein EJV47_20065 [Hymenobacter gummosus]
MPLTPIVEVAIALALLYLLFSQIVSSVHELLVSFLGYRGKFLRRWLNLALYDPKNKNWVELLYLHPTVDTLARRAGHPPAYIPPELFAKGLIDLVIDEARTHEFVTDLASGDVRYQVGPPAAAAAVPAAPAANAPAPAGAAAPANPEPLAYFKAGLARLEEGNFKALMRALLQDADASGVNTFDKLHQNLVGWYNDYMDRMTGWYKQRTRKNLFWLGLGLAVLANIDSLHVAHYFWTHAAARQQAVAYAEKVAARDAKEFASALAPVPSTKEKQTADSLASINLLPKLRRYQRQVDSLTRELQDWGFPIGWATRGPEVPPLQVSPSAALPDTFVVALPAQAELRTSKNGQKTEFWQRPASWVRYTRPRPAAGLKPMLSRWQNAVLFEQPPKPAALALDAEQRRYLQWLALQGQDTLLYRALGGQTVAPPPPAPPVEPLPTSLRAVWQALWQHLPGWLLTAFALCLGGPFWFQVLQRFINVRNNGPRPAQNNTPPVPLNNRA